MWLCDWTREEGGETEGGGEGEGSSRSLSDVGVCEALLSSLFAAAFFFFAVILCIALIALVYTSYHPPKLRLPYNFEMKNQRKLIFQPCVRTLLLKAIRLAVVTL